MTKSHHHRSLTSNLLDINFGLIIATLLIFAYISYSFLTTRSEPTPSAYSAEDLYPVNQFDRGGYTKQEILESHQLAIRELTKLNERAEIKGKQKENDEGTQEDGENSDDNFMKRLVDISDRKTQRQLMALEALGMKTMEDFILLSELGYEKESPSEKSQPQPQMTSLHYTPAFFSKLPETFEYHEPDYSKLCYEEAFSLGTPTRSVDQKFCSNLASLGDLIKNGEDVPLLTLFTWWLDPMNDGEILSRKPMISNWNLLRPFIIPVVFTNHRMNMAFANGNGWPCFPVTETAKDGRPLFGPLASFIQNKLNSTFYGYAEPIAMFDPSILETLMGLKDQLLEKQNSQRLIMDGEDAPNNIIIHGESLKMSQVGTNPFLVYDNLHKFLRDNFNDEEESDNNVQGTPATVSLENSNYFIFKNSDFSEFPPLTAHDGLLCQYAIEYFLDRGGCQLIDASKTILAIRTYRKSNTNEWSRRYLYAEPFDATYNERVAMDMKRRNYSLSSEKSSSLLCTYWDLNDGSCRVERLGG